jgi:hypothetical protein
MDSWHYTSCIDLVDVDAAWTGIPQDVLLSDLRLGLLWSQIDIS